MISIIGLVATFVLVFGTYIISGGSIEVIIHALPFELPMLMGASFGAYMVGNTSDIVKASFGAIKTCFKGGHWAKQDYLDLLCLLFLLLKTIKTKGIPAIEPHIENPSESTIFKQYPKILEDHFAPVFICDTIRMITMSFEDPLQMEDLLQKQLDKHHHEAVAPADALQGMADALPAIGIVVAVLGVIKTMASIDQPPTILGAMIGGALVGTFLGVFVAYCIVGPFASKAKYISGQDAHFYMIIRDIIVSHVKGNPPQVSIEVGRGNVPSLYQPTFVQLEEALGNAKAA